MLKPSYRGEQVKPSLVALLHRGAAYFFGKRKGYLIFLLKNQKTTNGRKGNATRMAVSDYMQMHAFAFSMKAEGKA